MAEGKTHRYMGVKPFEAANRSIFFGRDDDVEGLFNLILSEKLVVLYGKSGYGKSSLLNAGVLPLFQEGDEPDRKAVIIEIRLGNYVRDKTYSPLGATLSKFNTKIPTMDLASDGKYLDDLYPDELDRPLWYHVKRRQSYSEGGRFVLVFDQFEEFFSYPVGEQEIFKKELAELIYSDIPQYLRKKISSLKTTEKQHLAQPMNVKAVFAIRADRISFLDSMTDVLPAILHKRYELRSLTPSQAREAIVAPSGLISHDFTTAPFEFTEPAIQKILHNLAATQSAGIEAFQLQIICQFIESQVEIGAIPDRDGNGLPDVDESDLPDMNNLYESYYKRQLNRLEPEEQRIAQTVLEEGLLSEDSTSGEGRRMSVDSQFLKQQYGIDDGILISLVNSYLIRKEPNTVGGESLEISHDTLVSPVLKMKKERKAREEILDAQKKEKEAKLLALQEKKRRQRSNAMTTVAVTGLIIAAWQYLVARKATLAEQQSKVEIEMQRNAANEALKKVIAVRKETVRSQIKGDEFAEFFQAANDGKLFLNKIDSLEKQQIAPSQILDEIDKYLFKIKK